MYFLSGSYARRLLPLKGVSFRVETDLFRVVFASIFITIVPATGGDLAAAATKSLWAPDN